MAEAGAAADLISSGKLLRENGIYRKKSFMQTTKLLFFTGLAATLVVFALTSGAGDTQEQTKAREALRQKMSELNTPSATTPGDPAPPPVPASPAQPAPPTAPVTPPQAQAIAPVTIPAPAPAMAFPGSSKFGPVPAAAEDANTAQARAALRQEMALLDDPGFAPVPAMVEDANAAQARAALRQEMALLASSSATAKRSAKSGYTATYIAPLVMQVPLSPLSGPKAARLAELLNRYNADQITPKDYHVQRAAIIAEP